VISSLSDMSHLELVRLEKRMCQVTTEMQKSIDACVRIESELTQRIVALEERLLSLIAKAELGKTSVSENPIFEYEESDDSV